MATIINNPPGGTIHERDEDSSAGVVIGIVIAILVLIAFFVFAWPYIRNGATPGTPNTGGTPTTQSTPGSSVSGSVNVQLPKPNSSGTPGSSGSSGY